MMNDIFSKHESNVRSYCRSYPATFASAKGSTMTDTSGRHYLDFLSGAGTLNYGHNNRNIVGPVIEYIESGGVTHSLDMFTKAKETFHDVILAPRGLSYKLQFPGPTGTNGIEAAIKLARKVTKRTNVVAFTNAFHGMSLGALALTTNVTKRSGAGIPLSGATFMPYDGFLGTDVDTMPIINAMLMQKGSGVDAPAAIILETVQGEGGLGVARPEWCRRLATLAKEIGALLIVDDIQAGNGRTGTFFSFEQSEIVPDIVVLSKSLSGFGSPFSLVLLRPELDIWAPGEHNGTFRGNNLAFVGATSALQNYWADNAFQISVTEKAEFVRQRLSMTASKMPGVTVKGRGMFMGLEFVDKGAAEALASDLFKKGVIIETCGHHNQVLKLLPPLVIEDSELQSGLDLIDRQVGAYAAAQKPVVRVAAATAAEHFDSLTG